VILVRRTEPSVCVPKMSLDIHLNRVDRIYKPGDKVTGALVLETSGGFAHSGVTVQMTGAVTLQLSARSVGLFEAFYNSLKPITMVDYTVEIEKTGKIADGKSEIPFEFDLRPLEGQELYETYHGVYVNVSYTLKADVIRKFLGRNLNKTVEFIVELPTKIAKGVPPTPSQAETFAISPESLEVSAKKAKAIPDFHIKGELTSTKCMINDPFIGKLVLERCEEPIKCIELQLVRVETCGCAEGFAKEATEIQNIQIVDGDIVHGFEVPIHMVFPRLFTCPSVAARTFKIDFEANIVLMFPDGRLVTKKYARNVYLQS